MECLESEERAEIGGREEGAWEGGQEGCPGRREGGEGRGVGGGVVGRDGGSGRAKVKQWIYMARIRPAVCHSLSTARS